MCLFFFFFGRETPRTYLCSGGVLLFVNFCFFPGERSLHSYPLIKKNSKFSLRRTIFFFISQEKKYHTKQWYNGRTTLELRPIFLFIVKSSQRVNTPCRCLYTQQTHSIWPIWAKGEKVKSIVFAVINIKLSRFNPSSLALPGFSSQKIFLDLEFLFQEIYIINANWSCVYVGP